MMRSVRQEGENVHGHCVDDGEASQAGSMVEKASFIAILFEVDRVVVFGGARERRNAPSTAKGTFVQNQAMSTSE